MQRHKGRNRKEPGGGAEAAADIEEQATRPAVVASLLAPLATLAFGPVPCAARRLTRGLFSVQSLRVLDPGGVVLEAVGAPIQEYLRRRKDTIRGIVTLLTDDSAAAGGGESLYEELAKTAAMAEADEREDDDAGAADTEEEAAAAHAWEPDPVRGADRSGLRALVLRPVPVFTALLPVGRRY